LRLIVAYWSQNIQNQALVFEGYLPSGEEEMVDVTKEEDEKVAEEPAQIGHLVHLFRGTSNPVESLCFRRICMKRGLRAWHDMHRFLPWRPKSDLRATLVKLLRKQAIGEYPDIRADPLIIGLHNRDMIRDAKTGNPDHIVKNGRLVRKRYDRTTNERRRDRDTNAYKYDLPDNESLQVRIPSIMSLEYLRNSVSSRVQTLKLERAALIWEMARRKGTKPEDFGMGEMKVIGEVDMGFERPFTVLEHIEETPDMFF
jgi:hypothetical protein